MFDSNHEYNIYGPVDNIFNGKRFFIPNYYKERVCPSKQIINLHQNI